MVDFLHFSSLSVKENGQVIEVYVYDGDGKRIKKTDATSERVYIYGGLNVLYEVNLTTHMDAVYIYGPAGRSAKKVNDVQEYYHTDQLGSTRLITSENGEITEEIQYEPFGEQINVSEEKYTYNGKERDETGLYYFGARYYDPEMGRFLTRDPLPGDLLSPQTLNSYVYCLNNPLRYTDSQGMSTDEVPTYPDGTYSSVLTELYNKLQQALNSMTAEDWAYIEGLLNSSDADKKMTAVKTILFYGGLISRQQLISKDPLTITFGTMRFDFEFVDFKNEDKWGEVGPNEAGTSYEHDE